MEQANRAVQGRTRTIMQCLETRCDVQWAWNVFNHARMNGLLSTVPEELPKSDFAVCRDRARARSRTSHVETSIQVKICSMVGEVSGD